MPADSGRKTHYGFLKKMGEFIKTPKGRKNPYTAEDFEAMKKYFQKKFKMRKFQPSTLVEIPEAPKFDNAMIGNKSIEELKKEHPLVKDERFFVLSYFPEV